jgi:hypothetical protein
MGPFLVIRSKWEKVPIRELHPFFEHLPIKEDLSKVSQNYIQETNFDMGFQKINSRDRYKKVVVSFGCVSQTVAFE